MRRLRAKITPSVLLAMFILFPLCAVADVLTVLSERDLILAVSEGKQSCDVHISFHAVLSAPPELASLDSIRDNLVAEAALKQYVVKAVPVGRWRLLVESKDSPLAEVVLKNCQDAD